MSPIPTKTPVEWLAAVALCAVVLLLLVLLLNAVFFPPPEDKSGLLSPLLEPLKDGLLSPENMLVWQLPVIRGMDNDWIAIAATANADEGEHDAAYETTDNMQVETDVPHEIKIEIMNLSDDLGPLDFGGTAPRVLIYHTHTAEAYTPTPENSYKPTSSFRTTDNQHNIVTVGTALTKALREKYGFSVLHDVTNHEPPKLGTSYERSLKTMLSYKEKYPTIEMFIDVHRDAYNTKTENTDYVVIDGKRVARMMFVVGTGEGKTSAGFAEKPHYQENYKLALRITNALNSINPRLTRPIRVKTGRYNQQVSTMCLLIEIGHNANTLEEALNAVPYLAEAIAKSATQPDDGTPAPKPSSASTPKPSPSPKP